MATFYVDKDATGAEDGLTWATAYQGLAAAVAAEASGSSFEVSGGTYNEKLGTVTNYSLTVFGSTEAGHDDPVIFDCTGLNDHFYLTAGTTAGVFRNLWIRNVDAGKYLLNLNNAADHTFEDVWLSSALGRGVVLNSSFTGTVNFRRTRLNNVAYQWVDGRDAAWTLNIESSIWGNHLVTQNGIHHVGVGTININHSIMGNAAGSIVNCTAAASGDVTIDNSILLPAGSSDGLNPHTLSNAGSGAVTVSNSLVMPAWRGNNSFLNVTDGGGNVGLSTGDDPTVAFVSPQRPIGSISLTIDDAGRFDDNGSGLSDAEVLANLCTAKGVKASFCVEVAAITADRLARIVNVVNQGHSISSHGMSGAVLNAANFPAFDIQYTGAASAATMDIANNVLTLKEDAVTVATIALNDTTVNVQCIVPINALTDWSCSTAAAGNSGWLTASKTLEDVTAQDVKTASYEANLDADRFYDYELRESRLALDAAIQPYVPTYTCKTHVYSVENGDAGSEQASFDAGYLASRGNVSNIWNFDNVAGGLRPHLSFGHHLGAPPFDMSDTSDLVRRIVALGEAVKYGGYSINLYNHNLTGTSPSADPTTEANWETIIDTLLATGVRILSYDEQAVEMRASATEATANLEYTRDFTESDMAWVPSLTTASQANAAGGGSSVPVTGIDGEPFSAFDRDIGAVQHSDATNHPFHPSHL